MHKFIRIMLVVLALMVQTKNAFSFGEGFKIESIGTEYCGDYNKTKFKASNNVDFYVIFYSDSELIVSYMPNFQPEYTFSMYGYTYIIGKSNAAFVGSAFFDDGSYATIQGTVTFNKYNAIKSAKGVFIQSGLVKSGCFSKGSLYTTKRLF